MRFLSRSTVCIVGTAVLLCLPACGGKLAKTGCAAITGVRGNGDMRLRYADGTCAWKRLQCDNMPEDTRTAERNMLVPSRYVETKSGGTLTFPDGKTIVYHDRYPYLP